MAFVLNQCLPDGNRPLDGQTKFGRGPSFMGGYPTVEAKRSFRINKSLQKADRYPVNILTGKHF